MFNNITKRCISFAIMYVYICIINYLIARIGRKHGNQKVSYRMFTDISKDMLKSAIEKLRPEFQQMADQAVTRAVELRDKRVFYFFGGFMALSSKFHYV